MTENKPCPEYSWCSGHDDLDETLLGGRFAFHCNRLEEVSAGGSSLAMEVNWASNEGFTFLFDIQDWSIKPSEIDREFADIHSIFDQMEAQARAFLLAQEIGDREAALDGLLSKIGGI